MKWICLLSLMLLTNCAPKFNHNDVVHSKNDTYLGIVRDEVPHLFGLDNTYIVCFQFGGSTFSCAPYKGDELVKVDMTFEELWQKWREERL